MTEEITKNSIFTKDYIGFFATAFVAGFLIGYMISNLFFNQTRNISFKIDNNGNVVIEQSPTYGH